MASLTPELQNKYDKLLERLSSLRRVVVAFSGGLDSGFLLYAAVKALGKTNVLAVTSDSASLATDDRDYASEFVASIDLQDRHIVIRTAELDDERYASNTTDRCFFCKQELYGKLTGFASEKGYDHVLDGCNASDIGDFRPGRKAASEFSIQSPLLDAGLYKKEIREIARSEGLMIWDKPQAACLSSRIPYGSRVTREKLHMVERAEKHLRELGFRQMRVRHHDMIARIEVEEDDFERISAPEVRAAIIDEFRRIGFVWVTLDLKPFRTGSMNINIKDEKHG